QTVLGSVPAAGLPDGPAEIILRPEALRLGEGASTGVVEAVRFGGSGYVVDLTVGDQRFSIRHPDNPPALGDVVRLGIASGARHILAGDESAVRGAAKPGSFSGGDLQPKGRARCRTRPRIIEKVLRRSAVAALRRLVFRRDRDAHRLARIAGEVGE